MNVETKLIQNKLGLLKLAEKLGNVTEILKNYTTGRQIEAAKLKCLMS
jgi:hypothetical protein